MDYFAEIAAVIAYIEDHLNEPLAPATICERTHRSMPHFYRIYDHVVGDTVMNYIRKRRLSQAAANLVASGGRILDIALQAGYESQQTFNRAFTRAFGVAPGKWRTSAASGEPYPRCDIQRRRFALARVSFESVMIMQLEPQRVASFHACRPSTKGDAADRVAGAAWTGLVEWQMADQYHREAGAGAPLPATRALGEWFVQKGLHCPPETRYFGFDNPWPPTGAECGYEAWAAVDSAARAAGQVVLKNFAGGLYAMAPATYGRGSNLRETWRMLHAWLLESEYTYGEHQWLEEHLTAPGRGGFHGINLLLAICPK